MAKPGDLVQMCDPATNTPTGDLFLVTLAPQPPYSPGKPEGLFSFPGPVYLTRLPRTEGGVMHTVLADRGAYHPSMHCRIIEGAWAELRITLNAEDSK